MLSASTGADLADFDFLTGSCSSTAHLPAPPRRRFASTLHELDASWRPGGRLEDSPTLSPSAGIDFADIVLFAWRGKGCTDTAQLHASLQVVGLRRLCSGWAAWGGQAVGWRVLWCCPSRLWSTWRWAVFWPTSRFAAKSGGGGFCISTALLLIWLPEGGCTATARARAAAIGKPNQAVSRKPGHLASGLRNSHSVFGGRVEYGSAIPLVCTYTVEHWDSIFGTYLCTCFVFCTCVYLICWSSSGHFLLG